MLTMPPSETSVVVPQFLWLSSKTPVNFNSASDRVHKTIIAVHAQHYYTKKRAEQGAALLELQQQGSFVPLVPSAPFGSPVSAMDSHIQLHGRIHVMRKKYTNAVLVLTRHGNMATAE
ncbi:hypothetical protein PV04_09078 [Phialophora macrospora]|uniref:Uncharacterized protein n=1 Tax=Phialophora macrospora TaxID=1851006 RepID=A0A0D2F7Z2_9EURO|nr:hypothetical protein PV04_09078 [Phialophora macrospora]